MSSVTTRVRGLSPWHPRLATRELLARVDFVLAEYERYLPLTVRQIFYRLVGAYRYDKTDNAYGRLCEHLNRARRAERIPFSTIRDGGTTLAEPTAWIDEAELVRTFVDSAKRFRLDRQRGQPVKLFFAVEAAGMVQQIERVADPFGIAVQSSGGFDSVTEKYELAHRLGQWPRVEVLHIGDHDPSGWHLFASMAEDVCAMARHAGYQSDIGFTRLAVTPEQIARLDLQTAPPKATDRRKFDGETVQCEAIPPDELAAIVLEAIEQRLDHHAYDVVLDAERRVRAQLAPRLISLLGGGS